MEHSHMHAGNYYPIMEAFTMQSAIVFIPAWGGDILNMTLSNTGYFKRVEISQRIEASVLK